MRRPVETFSDEMCKALFEAILHHDTIDESATLPETIHVDYPPTQFLRAFGLTEQMWRTGVDGPRLRRIARSMVRERSLSRADLKAFKHVRARFKHLRFAFALFGADHRYDHRLDRMTIVMGRLQDMLKHRLGPRFGRNAMRLRFWTSRLGLMIVTRSTRRFRPTSHQAFRAYVAAEIRALRDGIEPPAMSVKAFHDLRKIISRQVALYDTLKILDPSPYHRRLSRYLGSLNGMMGAMHDRLVAEKLLTAAPRRSDLVILPTKISDRLAAFVDRHATAHDDAN